MYSNIIRLHSRVYTVVLCVGAVVLFLSFVVFYIYTFVLFTSVVVLFVSALVFNLYTFLLFLTPCTTNKPERPEYI